VGPDIAELPEPVRQGREALIACSMNRPCGLSSATSCARRAEDTLLPGSVPIHETAGWLDGEQPPRPATNDSPRKVSQITAALTELRLGRILDPIRPSEFVVRA
jgi:hypothetical protein